MAAIGTGDERRLRELATRLRAEEAECFVAQLYAAAFTMSGIIYTRIGRRFFNDRELERAV